MKTHYIITLSLLLLTACGNKTENAESQDEAEDTVDTEYIDNNESETYSDGHVCVSEDGRITIKSGVIPDSGTSPGYWTQWIVTDSTGESHTMRLPGETVYQDKIHAITKTDGTVYYIVNCYMRASASEGEEWLRAYKIVGDTVQEVNVLDGGKNIARNEFDVEYCIPDWYDATKGAGFNWILDYDAETKSLYVPITDRWEIIDRYHVWRFNGECFVHMGEQPHKGLHKSLGEYNRLVRWRTTKDYLVRVDSLDSHELRCALWKKPKTISDKPDLVIKGGKTQYNEGSHEDYRFRNGSSEYVVNYCEKIELEEGIGEHHDFLLVKQNGKVVIKQELGRD
jgi:hypothetical protein